MKKDDELRRKLTNAFDDFEAEPLPQTWDNIRMAIQPKRKKRPFLLFWLLAGLGLLAGVGGVLTMLEHSGSGKETLVVVPEKESNIWTLQRSTDSGDSPLQTRVGESSQVKKGQLKTGDNTAQIPSLDKAPSSEKNYEEPGLHQSYAVKYKSESGAKTNTVVISPLVVNPYKDAVILHDKTVNPVVLKLSLHTVQRYPIPEIAIADIPANPVVLPDQPHKRKGIFTVGFNLIAAYQQIQTQTHNSSTASNFHFTNTFDTRRLGASFSLDYQLPIQRRADLGIALTWMNLPYQLEYDAVSTNQVQIDIQSSTQYRVAPIVKSVVKEEQRLQWAGLQLEYGYRFKIFKQKIRLHAGAEYLLQFSNKQAGMWLETGLDIPLGNGKFQITPVFQYQIHRNELPDNLIQTRLYGPGLGISRKF